MADEDPAQNKAVKIQVQRSKKKSRVQVKKLNIYVKEVYILQEEDSNRKNFRLIY
jgi:hypothetical protein